MPLKDGNVLHMGKCLPRMSWRPENLYNLWQRTYGPPNAETSFVKTTKTMFQQKWISKRLIRAYHGDWIQEKKFFKHYVPGELPPLVSKPGEPETPVSSLFLVEVEKRIDVVIHRCCFAPSIYAARGMVLAGKVKVNGQKHRDPNYKLNPGDLITVDPTSIITLNPSSQVGATTAEETGASATAAPAATEEASAESADTVEATATSEAAESTEAAEAASETAQATEATGAAEAEAESSEADADGDAKTVSKSAKRAALQGPLPFRLPDFAAPFMFIPPYVEVSFPTCSFVYLRHPTAGPGYSEIASPYNAAGETLKLTVEWYASHGRRTRKRKPHLAGKRLGA